MDRRSSEFKIIKIYDSYIDIDDKEHFLCLTNGCDKNLVWLDKVDVHPRLIDDFRQSKKDTLNRDKFTSCNTDKDSKFYTCNFKVRTRGIVIAAFNCGIILGFREIFGAESLSQVAQFYLDLCSYYQGIFMM